MFLSAVSGGLVALGLVATATRVGTAFYAFCLALLPTLTFVGLVTTIASVREIASATYAALALSPSRVASSPALPSVFAEHHGLAPVNQVPCDLSDVTHPDDRRGHSCGSFLAVSVDCLTRFGPP